MKRFLAIALAAAFLALPVSLVVTGCKTPTTETQPSNIVLNAEKTIASSFEVIDTFLKFEYTNRASLPASVTAAADAIRRDAPIAFMNARSVLRAYKETQTPEQQLFLEDSLVQIQALANLTKQ
jgi:NH3-dependent NAD+ synthetase